MAHPNPTWLQGKRKPRQKVSERWYIKVDERYGVSADRYNLILAETGIVETPEGKKTVPLGRAFTDTFGRMAEVLVSKGVSQTMVDAFKERTKVLSTSIKDGRIVVSIPDGFNMDPSPFAE